VLDIRVKAKGGGHTSQVYAIRQAIAKAVVAYYTKYIDAYSALELKKKLVSYDRTLLIADPRRAEPKKFGGHGARARRQKRWVCYMDMDGIFTNAGILVTGERVLLYCWGCIALHCHVLFTFSYAMAPCKQDAVVCTNRLSRVLGLQHEMSMVPTTGVVNKSETWALSNEYFRQPPS
jgi:hypothetical protein